MNKPFGIAIHIEDPFRIEYLKGYALLEYLEEKFPDEDTSNIGLPDVYYDYLQDFDFPEKKLLFLSSDEVEEMGLKDIFKHQFRISLWYEGSEKNFVDNYTKTHIHAYADKEGHPVRISFSYEVDIRKFAIDYREELLKSSNGNNSLIYVGKVKPPRKKSSVEKWWEFTRKYVEENWQ